MKKNSRCNLDPIDVSPDDQIDTSDIPEITAKQFESAVRGMFAPNDKIEVGLGQSKKLYSIVFEREANGRWIAELPDSPGVMAYGKTKVEAKIAVTTVFLRTRT